MTASRQATIAAQAVAFHANLTRTLLATGARPYAGGQQVLASWTRVYLPMLVSAGCPKAEVRRLRAWYLDLTQPAPEAVVSTLHSELSATNTPEFIAMLKMLVCRAKLRGGALAERAGLSTSQLYSMTDTARSVLPLKGEQVQALARACGLDRDKVEWVMRLWAEFRACRDSPTHRRPDPRSLKGPGVAGSRPSSA